MTKRPKYQKSRVPEYWVLDEPSRTVERWRPDDDRPEIIADALTWLPTAAAAPFTLDLDAFFAEVPPPEE